MVVVANPKPELRRLQILTRAQYPYCDGVQSVRLDEERFPAPDPSTSAPLAERFNGAYTRRV